MPTALTALAPTPMAIAAPDTGVVAVAPGPIAMSAAVDAVAPEIVVQVPPTLMPTLPMVGMKLMPELLQVADWLTVPMAT